MDRNLATRSAATQLALVAITSITLALALPSSFFETWGWLSGPTAWALCATLTARFLSLPTFPTLLGAALAGIPSLLAVVLGLHWLGALTAVGLFGVWCGLRLSPQEPATA